MKCPPGTKSGTKGPGIYEDHDLNRDGIKDQTLEGNPLTDRFEVDMRPFLKLANGKFHEMKPAPADPILKPSGPSGRVYAFTEQDVKTQDVKTRFFVGRIRGHEHSLMSFGLGQRVGEFSSDTQKALRSTMVISGLTIEMNRELIAVGAMRFCPTLNDMRDIQHRAYEQKGGKVTQVHDTTDLSWAVAGPNGQLERLNLDETFYNKMPEKMVMKYLTPSEKLIRPFLQGIQEKARAIQSGEVPCVKDDVMERDIHEALEQWYGEASKTDLVRADRIRGDAHIWEGLHRAAKLILEGAK